MLGLIGLGLAAAAGYGLHNKKVSNSYMVAKYLEHCIDNEEPCKVRGFFDKAEVANIMADDGYNLFDYIK